MSQGTTPMDEPQGWAIDWTSGEIRRRFLATAAIGLTANLAQIVVSVLLPAWLFGLEANWATWPATGALAVALCWILVNAMKRVLKTGIASKREKESFLAYASKRDRKRHGLWLSVVALIPLLLFTVSSLIDIVSSFLSTDMVSPFDSHEADLIWNAVLASQVGAVAFGIFGGHAAMMSLRDPACGPLPVLPQGALWNRSRTLSKQDKVAVTMYLTLGILPLVGIFILAEIFRA